MAITCTVLTYRRERVTASGGEVGRLSIYGGAEVGTFYKYYLFFLSQKIKRKLDYFLLSFSLVN